MISPAEPSTLQARLAQHIGRYVDKTWDWDAFPANRGFPELARAQMRYIGSGGSPRTDDRSTLPTQHFTWSLIYLQPEHYAAVHVHEVEEVFLVHEGIVTVTWDFDDEVADVRLGPADAILNPPAQAHGFRNDGPTDAVFQIMVGSQHPLLPRYISHPSDTPDTPLGSSPAPAEAYARHRSDFDRHVVRASDISPMWVELSNGSRVARYPYVAPSSTGGRVEPIHYAVEIQYIPPGAELPLARQPCETAIMVTEGRIDITWEDSAGERASTRLGVRDLVLIPADQTYVIANKEPASARLIQCVGDPSNPDPFLSEAQR